MEMLKYDSKLQYDSYYVGSLFRNPEKSKEWHQQVAKEKLEKCGFTDHLKMNIQLKLEELQFTSSMTRAWTNMVVDELPKEYLSQRKDVMIIFAKTKLVSNHIIIYLAIRNCKTIQIHF